MPENTGVKQTGRFRPGQSGNPRGKPKGARHKACEALDAIGRDEATEVLKAVVSAAKNGDMRAADVILRRAWPERKGRPVVLDLPAITDASGITAAIAVIAHAATSGEITPDEAAALVNILESQRRAIETADLEQRITKLEAKAKK